MADLLHRQTSDLSVRANGDGRTVFGLLVPYGETATVDDGRGPYRERFVFGAFTRSLAEWSHKVKLTVNHDVRGRLPIGRFTLLEERTSGLYGEAHIPQTRDGDDALELVRSGVVDAFSVGFRGIRERRADDGAIERTEAALREASLVGFPAYSGALVAGVRTAERSLSVDLARRSLDLTLMRFRP